MQKLTGPAADDLLHPPNHLLLVHSAVVGVGRLDTDAQRSLK